MARKSRPVRLFPEIKNPKQRGFLMAFVEHGQRKKAAEQVGIDRRTHCVWLKSDPVYAQAFERAEQFAADVAEDKLYELGIEGYNQVVWQNGIPVGVQKRYLPTLLLAIVNAMKPERYRWRGTVEHDASEGLQRLTAIWMSLRDNAMPERTTPEAALDEAQSYDAEWEPTSPQMSQGQDQWEMLDEANRISPSELDGDEGESE
jgi:hypothetical protein